MADFPELYDQFLGLIENEVDRIEVLGHLTKMAESPVESPEHLQSRRQLVRVLKSRTPHLLPKSWLADPSLEDGPAADEDEEIRKDWKHAMESEGVFFFGHIPSWEDIDGYHEELTKHFGVGDRPPRAGSSKYHHVPPTQKSHGNTIGVRHMIARLAALPRFRGKIEALARAVGKPGASYRELVRFMEDDSYKSRVREVYDREFAGQREAADKGTGMAGENFKLSAAQARGRRADEHQDPRVDELDVSGDLARAAEQVADAGIKAIDDTSKRLLQLEKQFSQYKTARGAMQAVRRMEAKFRSARSRYQRLRNQKASREQKLEALAKVHETGQDLLFAAGVLQEVLADNAELRDAIGANDRDVRFLNTHINKAHAAVGLSRAMMVSAEHEDKVGDAGEHKRPAGPDAGVDEYSFYGVPMSELEDMWDDLREAGVPGRLEFKLSPREDREPARPETAPEDATPEAAASEAAPPTRPTPARSAPSRQPAAPRQQAQDREVGERMRERGIRLAPELQTPAGGDEKLPAEDRLTADELREAMEPLLQERGLEWASAVAVNNFLDVVNDPEVGGANAKLSDLEALIDPNDRKFFKPVAGREEQKPKPAAGASRTRIKPAQTPARAPKTDGGDLLSGVDTSNLPRGAEPFLREIWRNQMLRRIKDDGGSEADVDAKLKALAARLRGVKEDDKDLARERFLTILEEFLKANDLPLTPINAWRRKRMKKRLPMNGARLSVEKRSPRLELNP